MGVLGSLPCHLTLNWDLRADSHRLVQAVMSTSLPRVLPVPAWAGGEGGSTCGLGNVTSFPASTPLLHGRVSAIVTFQSGELTGSDPVCEGLGRKLCSVIKQILWTNRINV